ncbi:hypothetical protein N9C59_05515 [Flavobacteriales bacterium]|jgi:hypothetical protein|nr:hypothetical protein [Flavobacteriales bacterium]
MKKISLHFIFTILISSTLITSCNSENSVKTTEKEVTNDNEATHSIEIDIVDHDFEFMPPSPIQIASILKKANMSYEEGLTNDISNADIYSTKFKQTINFGVYACDLAYCVTNDKYEEAGRYLKVAKKMSAKIGLESIFQSDHLVERFEKNIGNQDSIMDILFHVQMMTDDYIHDNDLRDLSVIYFTGAWVEGMNIGTHTILGNNDHKISVLLSEQMTIARSIIKGLRAVQNQTDDLVDLTDHIDEVVEAYNNLWSVKQEGENIEYLDVELKHEEVISISEMILELREEITL